MLFMLAIVITGTVTYSYAHYFHHWYVATSGLAFAQSFGHICYWTLTIFTTTIQQLSTWIYCFLDNSIFYTLAMEHIALLMLRKELHQFRSTLFVQPIVFSSFSQRTQTTVISGIFAISFFSAQNDRKQIAFT